MGFNMMPDVSRREALQALPTFAFKELGCHYLEVVDPCLSAGDWAGLPYKVEHLNWYAIDLTKSEGELLAGMKSSGRNCIRKSIKNGVTIEEASDIGFAQEYYDQYKDVLAKRSMAPAYSLDYVQKLIETLLPTGHLLLLRARNFEGVCIATGIFLALNKTAVFWGAASWRQHQSLRPNEPLAWSGIQKLKSKGIQELHFGGQCEQYKEKLGCYEVPLHRLMRARYSVADGLLDLVTSPKSARYRNWVLRRL
jgi:lipid II:glycine glycyltransferase (peptidoglycan interpeptide bridge formation enzyme)